MMEPEMDIRREILSGTREVLDLNSKTYRLVKKKLKVNKIMAT